MARVVWSDQATGNLREIIAYLGSRDNAAANRFGRGLFVAGQSLGEFPNRGRPASRDTRELVSVPPYVIRYEVVGDVVLILSVRHNRRRPLA